MTHDGTVKLIFAKKLLLGFQWNVLFLLDKLLSTKKPVVFTIPKPIIVSFCLPNYNPQWLQAISQLSKKNDTHGEEAEIITMSFSLFLLLDFLI